MRIAYGDLIGGISGAHNLEALRIDQAKDQLGRIMVGADGDTTARLGHIIKANRLQGVFLRVADVDTVMRYATRRQA